MKFIDFIGNNWWIVLLFGFIFGIGFEIASLLIWFLCDAIKQKYNIPLG